MLRKNLPKIKMEDYNNLNDIENNDIKEIRDVELKKSANYFVILALAIGSISGTSLYYGTNIAANISGYGSLISWFILGLVSIYIAMLFGELSSLFPYAGGVYEFGKHAYNKLIAFIIAWTAWLVGNITSALIIISAVNMLNINKTFNLFGFSISAKIIIAILIILILNLFAYLGIELSGFVFVVLSLLMILSVLYVVFPGIFNLFKPNFKNFLGFSSIFKSSFFKIFASIFMIAECFFGWESVTYLAEETKNPKKIIPKALIHGTIIVGIIAFSLSLIAFIFLPKETILSSKIVFFDLAKRFNLPFFNILPFILFIILIGSAFDNQIGLPRLILSLSRDNLFFKQFQEVHKKFRTPYKAIYLQTIISIIFFILAFGNYKNLLSIMLPLASFMYILVIGSVFILRNKENINYDNESYKAPFGKIGSLLIVLFFLTILFSWIIVEPNALHLFYLALSILSFSLPLFLLISLYYDPKMIINLNNLFAYFNLLTERINMPSRIKKQIFSFIGDVKDKIVLEYGSGIGTITKDLVRKIGKNGVLYAVDFSERNIKITKKRILGLRNIAKTIFIHDPDQITRVHSSIEYADVIVSAGLMSYFQDVDSILKRFSEILPEGGRICLIDYVNYYKIIPNKDWLSNIKKIKERFKKYNLQVEVKVIKGLFWSYLFIYGIKYKEEIPVV